MLKLVYSDVWQSISNVMSEDLADQNVVDDLVFLFNQLDTLYKCEEIKVAMDTLQTDDYEEGYEKLAKAFKKMDKRTLYDIVSRVSFMAGIAHAEQLRINRDKAKRKQEQQK